MSSLFDDLKEGLEEAIAYEKGTGEASVGTYTVLPVLTKVKKMIPRTTLSAGIMYDHSFFRNVLKYGA